MERQRLNETTACEATRAQFPAFLAGNLKAEARGRVRGHLLSCRSCALAFSNAVTESMTPELTAKFQRPMPRPPVPVLEALGVWNEREGMVWSSLQSLDTKRTPWAQEELGKVRKALQGALLLWALAQPARRASRSPGMRAPTLGADEEWPSQIDVEVVDSSGQPQGRTVRFEVIEPPTVTPTGEFLLALRTEESGVAGWFLCCTVTIGGVKVTFSGELQEEVDNWGWQARIEATGLPASQEPVVIPLDPWVHLSLQERPQTEESRSQPTDLEATPAWALLVGARSGDHSAAREEAPGAALLVSETTETLPLEGRVWLQAASAHVVRATPSSAAFGVGEQVRIGVSTTRDALIYLLDVDAGGAVTLLFPVGDWRENSVRGKERRLLPPENDPPLAVQNSPGEETFIAIAVEQPVPLLAEWQQAAADISQPPRIVSQADLARLARELACLPREQWVVRQYQFVVRE